MPKNRVRQIICGIMYSHSFKMLDRWGDIADAILYNNKYFNTEYFPKIGSSNMEKSLNNDPDGHSIKLTANNLIYTHSIQSNFEQEIKEFEERITNFLIPKVIEDNSLITRRIGIVYNCEITSKGIEIFSSKYFKPEFNGISDFRFSKKESTIEGKLWSDKSDYINKIYTVGNLDEKTSGISFDYQMHYSPPQSYIKDKFPNVIKKSKALLCNEILSLGE